MSMNNDMSERNNDALLLFNLITKPASVNPNSFSVYSRQLWVACMYNVVYNDFYHILRKQMEKLGKVHMFILVI